VNEDELFFAIETLRGEVQEAKNKLKQSTFFLESQDKVYERNEMVRKSLTEALKHLLGSPVVSLTEYRSLTSGLATTKKQLIAIQEKRFQTRKIRNQALTDLPRSEAQLADLELQLELYEPPRVVLEFKKNDKQRSEAPDQH